MVSLLSMVHSKDTAESVVKHLKTILKHIFILDICTIDLREIEQRD